MHSPHHELTPEFYGPGERARSVPEDDEDLHHRRIMEQNMNWEEHHMPIEQGRGMRRPFRGNGRPMRGGFRGEPFGRVNRYVFSVCKRK